MYTNIDKICDNITTKYIIDVNKWKCLKHNNDRTILMTHKIVTDLETRAKLNPWNSHEFLTNAMTEYFSYKNFYFCMLYKFLHLIDNIICYNMKNIFYVWFDI